MSKITLNNVGSLIDATTAKNTINTNFDTIEAAFDNTISRDGTSPNQMTSNFDMNSHRILNLPAPTQDNDPVRLQDLISAGEGHFPISAENLTNGVTGTGAVVLQNSPTVNFPTLIAPNIGNASAITVNKVTIAQPIHAATLIIDDNKTFEVVNSLALAGTDGSVSVLPAGFHALASPDVIQVWTANQSFAKNKFTLNGLTSGGVTVNVPDIAGSNTLTLPAGTTNFSATGGTSQVVKQTTAGGAFTVAQLAASDMSNGTTGSGSIVLSTSPTLVTPVLGTPASGVATNLTGTAAGLTAGNVTTNANLTGVITSAGNATSIASQTGTGTKFVVDTSPTLVTPNLGTPSAAVLTSATGLPISTGVSGLGTGVATFLATPSSANLITAVTDETGTGSLVFSASPTFTGTPLSTTAAVDTSTTQIATTAYVVGQSASATPTANATAGVVGTSTRFARADHVHPQPLGTLVSSSIPIGSAVSLTNNVAANVTSISLPAGTYMIYGNIVSNPAGTTTNSYLAGWFSTTSATLPTLPNSGGIVSLVTNGGAGLGGNTLPVGNMVLTVGSTTTLYLSIQAGFAISTMSAYGFIGALRII